MIFLGIVLAGVSFGYACFYPLGSTPIKDDWNRESRNVWLNGFTPCWYHRFRASEPASTSCDWIRSELDRLELLERGMDFSSSILSQAIKTRSPSISKKELQHQLESWSIPLFGSKYALETENSFSVILRTYLEERGEGTHHLHFKVFDTSKNESIIEIWDYRMVP